MINPDMDLPIEASDMEQSAEAFFEVDIDTLVQSLVVLGQLDPLEIVEGQPRWTEPQIVLIGRANQVLGEWQDQ